MRIGPDHPCAPGDVTTAPRRLVPGGRTIRRATFGLLVTVAFLVVSAVPTMMNSG